MYPKWIQHRQDIGHVLVTSEADEKEVRAVWKKRDAAEAKSAKADKPEGE